MQNRIYCDIQAVKEEDDVNVVVDANDDDEYKRQSVLRVANQSSQDTQSSGERFIHLTEEEGEDEEEEEKTVVVVGCALELVNGNAVPDLLVISSEVDGRRRWREEEEEDKDNDKDEEELKVVKGKGNGKCEGEGDGGEKEVYSGGSEIELESHRLELEREFGLKLDKSKRQRQRQRRPSEQSGSAEEMKRFELILILVLMGTAAVCTTGGAQVAKMIYFVSKPSTGVGGGATAPVYQSEMAKLAAVVASIDSSSKLRNGSVTATAAAQVVSASATNEQVVSLDGQVFEAPWLSRSQPKWMDACNKRSEETLINVILGPVQRHPNWEPLEEERKKRNRLIEQLEGVSEVAPEVASQPTPMDEKPLPSASVGGNKLLRRKRSNQQMSSSGSSRHQLESLLRVKKWPFLTQSATTATTFTTQLLPKRKPDSSSSPKLTGGGNVKTKPHWTQYTTLSMDKIRYFHSPTTNVYTSAAPSAQAVLNLTAVSSNATTKSQKEQQQHQQQQPPDDLADDKALYELVELISAADIRLAWYVNRGLNTAASLKRALLTAQLELDRQNKSQIAAATAVEIASGKLNGSALTLNGNYNLITSLDDANELRKWLPKLATLIRSNHDRQFNHHNYHHHHHNHQQQQQQQQNDGQQLSISSESLDPSKVLLNVSHYIQYFSVAFEQMIFEQVKEKVRNNHHHHHNHHQHNSTLYQKYRQLEKITLRLICDSENLISLLINTQMYEQRLSWIIRQIKKRPTMESMSRRTFGLLLSLERGHRYKFDTINSPYLSSALFDSSLEAAKVAAKRWPTLSSSSVPVFVYVSRQVMPLSQRQVSSLLRDRTILEDLEALVAFYESVLTHIYAPHKRKTTSTSSNTTVNQQQQQS